MRIERSPYVHLVPPLPWATTQARFPPAVPVARATGFLRGLLFKPKLDLSSTDGVSKPLQGNTLELFIDGDAFEQNLLTQIDSARQSIWMCFYLFDLKPGAIEDAIKRAVARGVTVRIVADDRSTTREFLEPMLSPVLQRLKAAGAHVVHAKTEGVAVNHRKLAVFDGRKAIVTGQNLTDNYIKGGVYHDAGVLLEGPSVRDVAQVFAESWMEGGGEVLSLPPRTARKGTDAWVSVITHQGQQDRNIEREVVKRIHASKKVVRLANPFAMSRAIADAVVAAHRRGVHVEWIWGRELTPTDGVMSLSTLKRLIDEGIAVYEHPSLIHAKLFVFDDEHTIVGSSNLDGYATWMNDEAVLHIDSKAFAEDAVKRFFAPDVALSKHLTEVPHVTTGSRLKDWALRALARITGRR